MKILLINTDDGPDYLSDLINYYFISKNYDIYTNHNLNFLFNDYKNKSELYGKGFTIYGKLDKKLKDNIKQLEIDQIKDSIKSFDLIVFTSIHRKFKNESIKELFYNLQKIVSNNNIFVVDGDDQQILDENIAKISKFHKRELIDKYKNLASPISFSFPEHEYSNKNYDISDKTQLLSPMDPRFMSTYVFNEEEYYEQYKKSIFGTTTKKGGWDCLRHYEILSVNTLLFFPGIDRKPSLTMVDFPVDLQNRVNNLFKKLILSEENIDSLEKIRLKYYTKNKFKTGLRRESTKLSKLNLIENNMNHIEQLNNEFNYWFKEFGTTASYSKIFN